MLSFVSNHPLERRRLCYTLTHHKNPYALATELKKRLLSLARSKKAMTDKNTKVFIEELSMHYVMIQLLIPLDPHQAIDVGSSATGPPNSLLRTHPWMGVPKGPTPKIPRFDLHTNACPF